MDALQLGSNIKRILVGVDGSKSSVAALTWACDLATGVEAEVDVLCAWQTPFPSFELMAIGLDFEVDELNSRPHQIAQYRIDKTILDACGEPHPMRCNRIIEEGNPGILLVGRSKDYDLLVLGNRGHTPVIETLLGSVSQHCVTHAHCPVVIVK